MKTATYVIWVFVFLLRCDHAHLPERGSLETVRLLYNSDITNVMTCTSPYHERGMQVRASDLVASVAEAHTADAFSFSPGTGWVPWWPSDLVPYDGQKLWFLETYGKPMQHTLSAFLDSGGDIVKVTAQACVENGVLPFISFRLNDAHHLEYIDRDPDPWMGLYLSRFYKENGGLRIDTLRTSRDARVHDWAFPESREYKIRLLGELCRNYEFRGLELDFMRFPSFFKETETGVRVEIMVSFIRRVRALLDSTTRAGMKRWLAVRIPAFLGLHAELGIDVPRFVEAGVDLAILSSDFVTVQQNDLAEIAASVPGTPVYLEMTHATMTGERRSRNYDSFDFRRTTDEQFYTSAHLAYSQNARGVSLFNFAYYREHGEGERGEFHEPPFHIMARLKDPGWLAQQPQHYFLAQAESRFRKPEKGLPRDLQKGRTEVLTLNLSPPRGGWVTEGRMRIQTAREIGGESWEVSMNGVPLEATSDVSEPYPAPYRSLLGDNKTLRAWKVPPDVLKDGQNTVEILPITVSRSRIIFLDLAVR